MSAIIRDWKPHFFHTRRGWYVRFGNGSTTWNIQAMEFADYLNWRGKFDGRET